jgi:threonyl-tRNA synthetase
MQLPHRFHLQYTDKDGTKKEPVMIHRAIFGSFERFLGVITEHFKGAFPTWLAPEQVRILPVTTQDPEILNYCKKLYAKLAKENVRVKLDLRNEKLSYKIRDAQSGMKVPYSLVIGGNEVKDNTVTVRLHGYQNTETVPFKDFNAALLKDIKTRASKRAYKSENVEIKTYTAPKTVKPF